MTETLHHFVNGRPIQGDSDRHGDVFNPAEGAVRARVPLASSEEVGRAIAAAEAAWPGWAATTPLRRARVLFRYLQLLEEHAEELTGLIVAEHGKVWDDARGSVQRGIEVVEFACGIPHLLKGEYSAEVGQGIDSWSMRKPLGVCAGITPFNFPAMVPMWMFPIAIACGNTFVLKPSEKVPSCALRLAELFAEAGLPEGVLNVVHGDGEAVDTLLTDPRVQAVSFVGSTPVAQHVYATAAAHGKRVQALAGAKNHLVVLPDADMEQATGALMGSAYGSAGERCMAVSVAVTVAEAGDAIVERLVPQVRNLKVAPGTEPGAQMGPLVTRQHLERVSGYVDLGVQEGAELLVDGRGIQVPQAPQGFFLGGCLFDRVQPHMRIYTDEIFGPVLSVVRVNTFDEALRLVNDNAFGNGAAVFTRDGDAARTFQDTAGAGMVGINVPIPVPLAFHTFGGWKQSLYGAHGVHGPQGVDFYTRLRTVTGRWPQGVRAEYKMPTH